MKNKNLREEYIDFFVNKGHVFIPSAPVIPENDPTCLFNSAGMQPLVPYLMGQSHPKGKRLVDYQKCIRLTDLESVGDKTHHTFFEMLGNWSLGDYFRKESIAFSFEFLTKVLEIPVERLAVTVFKGNDVVSKDDESVSCWIEHGINPKRIAYLGVEDNWWGPVGDSGPCGPDSEIFYFNSSDEIPEIYDPEDKRWVEIWNNVFMEYNKTKDNQYIKLAHPNIDTGMGLERVVAVLEGVSDNYQTSIWQDVIKKIEELSSLNYENNSESMRIIADHIRTSVMIIGDKAGIMPSNTDRGYILRRLIRRSIRHAKKLNIDILSNWDSEIALMIIDKYKKYYPELDMKKDIIVETLSNEKNKFNRTLEKGLKEFGKIIKDIDKTINKDLAFKLYDTYGFPIELTEELASENNLSVDINGFYEKFHEHQEKSRVGAEHKFKGGLSDNSEMNTKYHTATHLLNAALKQVIGPDVHQKGSNITEERMRFDFSCDHKLSEEEIRKTEELVNQYIEKQIPVTAKEMPKIEAINSGAEAMFVERYSDVVTVYSIGDISHEICGGPHVKNTCELGHFKIIKEEASSAGVRRIKAVLE